MVSGAVLAAGAIAAYWTTFTVPLLLDDRTSIADNRSIRRLWPLGPVLTPPNDAGVGGRPLLNLTYALNHAFGGSAVVGYHLVNLCIHVLAGWILFALVRRTLLRPVLAKRFGPHATVLALAVGAIWTWHPVQTGSVTYLSQRAESLMGLFYLLTLYCFVRACETDHTPGRRRWYAFSALSCLAGVATKEVIVTAPLVVLLYDRTFIAGSFRGAWRRHWPLHVALAATWVPLGCLMIGLHQRGVGFGQDVAWWAYGLTECRVIVRYLILALWPNPLIFDYGFYVPAQLTEVWPCVLVMASLLTATVIALRRLPVAGFAAGWFFLILAPTSSIVPVVGQPMAENRLYLPLAGLVGFAVLGMYALGGRRTLPVAAVIDAGLGLVSVQRNRDYASELSIWSDTVAKNPSSPRAHNNLGKLLLNLNSPGRLPEAIVEFEAALRQKPDLVEAQTNLGNALNAEGRPLEASAHYEEAVRLRPDDAEAHNNLGLALSQIPGRLNEGIAQFNEALRLNPDDARAHNNLGNAWLGMPDRLDAAVVEYEAALRLDPGDGEAHNNLGLALSRMPGRLPDAIREFREALRLKPDYAPGWHNLGVSWYQLGNFSEAASAFRKELNLAPDDPMARQALAAVLQQVGDR